MWEEILGLSADAPAADGAIDLTGQNSSFDFMTPQPDITAANTPAASPQDLENRRTGWMKILEKFSTNPNLQRAMMMVGAQLAQPLQPGQTWQGNAANAAVVGMNAYQLGQQADFAQKQALRKEGREDTRLALETERVDIARRGQAEAEKTGDVKRTETLLDIDTKQRTQQDTIKRGHALAEMEVERLREYRDGESLRRAERAVKEQEARIRQTIPDEALQQAELNKLNKLSEELSHIRTTSRLSTAKAREQEIENEDLERMTPEQRQQLRNQKGGGQQSAFIQRENSYRQIYQRLKSTKPDSPEIAGMTEDEYVARQHKEGTRTDAATQISRLINAGFSKDDPEIVALRQLLTGQTARSAGTPAPASPPADTKAGKGKSLPKVTTIEDYNKLPPNALYIAPDGTTKRKRAGGRP